MGTEVYIEFLVKAYYQKPFNIKFKSKIYDYFLLFQEHTIKLKKNSMKSKYSLIAYSFLYGGSDFN